MGKLKSSAQPKVAGFDGPKWFFFTFRDKIKLFFFKSILGPKMTPNPRITHSPGVRQIGLDYDKYRF
jgi:hypothetical protein